MAFAGANVLIKIKKGSGRQSAKEILCNLVPKLHLLNKKLLIQLETVKRQTHYHPAVLTPKTGRNPKQSAAGYQTITPIIIYRQCRRAEDTATKDQTINQ